MARPTPQAPIDGPLLAYLRHRFNAPNLRFERSPTPIHGGNDASIYGLSLIGGPWDRPLILRLYPASGAADGSRGESSYRATGEEVIQNAVVDQGFPAARVVVCCLDVSILNGAFILMERIPGRPYLADLVRPGESGVLGRIGFRALARLPGLLRELPRTLAEIEHRIHRLDPERLADALDRCGLDSESFHYRGYLADLMERVRRPGLEGLRPAADWLAEHQPDAHRVAICHNDIQPLNLLMAGGELSGVVDWANTLIADPAFEVGRTRLIFNALPMPFPKVVSGLGRRLGRTLARRYERSHRRLGDIDPARVDFYEALRGFEVLLDQAEDRLADRLVARTWNHPRGVRNVIELFERVSGVRPRLAIAPALH